MCFLSETSLWFYISQDLELQLYLADGKLYVRPNYGSSPERFCREGDALGWTRLV